MKTRGNSGRVGTQVLLDMLVVASWTPRVAMLDVLEPRLRLMPTVRDVIRRHLGRARHRSSQGFLDPVQAFSGLRRRQPGDQGMDPALEPLHRINWAKIESCTVPVIDPTRTHLRRSFVARSKVLAQMKS